jgi:hypothetical protein
VALPPIHLTPKTRKAKNRVSDIRARHPDWDGKTWIVMKTLDKVLFQPDKKGPWHLVEPLAQSVLDSRKDPILSTHSRWVHETSDENFTLEIFK